MLHSTCPSSKVWTRTVAQACAASSAATRFRKRTRSGKHLPGIPDFRGHRVLVLDSSILCGVPQNAMQRLIRAAPHRTAPSEQAGAPWARRYAGRVGELVRPGGPAGSGVWGQWWSNSTGRRRTGSTRAAAVSAHPPTRRYPALRRCPRTIACFTLPGAPCSPQPPSTRARRAHIRAGRRALLCARRCAPVSALRSARSASPLCRLSRRLAPLRPPPLADPVPPPPPPPTPPTHSAATARVRYGEGGHGRTEDEGCGVRDAEGRDEEPRTAGRGARADECAAEDTRGGWTRRMILMTRIGSKIGASGLDTATCGEDWSRPGPGHLVLNQGRPCPAPGFVMSRPGTRCAH